MGESAMDEGSASGSKIQKLDPEKWAKMTREERDNFNATAAGLTIEEWKASKRRNRKAAKSAKIGAQRASVPGSTEHAAARWIEDGQKGARPGARFQFSVRLNDPSTGGDLLLCRWKELGQLFSARGLDAVRGLGQK